MNLQEKEKRLMQKMEQARVRLARLRERRKLEMAHLACRYHLDKLSEAQLEQAFQRIAHEFNL